MGGTHSAGTFFLFPHVASCHLPEKIYVYWDLHVLYMLKRYLMYIRTSCAAAP